MTLISRINEFAAAVRDKFNTIAPRLLPPGGTTGQVLTKATAADNDVTWQTPTSGGGGSAESLGLSIAMRNNIVPF